MSEDHSSQLKHKINQSSILTDQEKKEWLFLLPKMNPEQIAELDRIISLNLPKTAEPQRPTTSSGQIQGGAMDLTPPSPTKVSAATNSQGASLMAKSNPPQTAAHFEPSVLPKSLDAAAKEVPSRSSEPSSRPEKIELPKISANIPNVTKPAGIQEPHLNVHPSVISGSPSSPRPRAEPDQRMVFEVSPKTTPTPYDVSLVSKLSVEDLRRASSVYEFFDDLTARIILKIKSHETSTQEIVASFQQSSLYRAYVLAGKQMLEGLEPTSLTRSEFEAVADFRTSLKKILATA